MGSNIDEALRSTAEQGDRISDDGDNIADQQHQPGQLAPHQAGRVRPCAFARAHGKTGLHRSDFAQQRGDVVDQDLGRHVDDQRLLAQP